MGLKDRWPKATFDLFDVHSLLEDIYAQPKKFLEAPYNASGYYHHCAASGSDCVDQPGSLNGYLWYDELHPSNKTSELSSFCAPAPALFAQTDTGKLRLHHCRHLPGRCRRQVQVRHPLQQLTRGLPKPSCEISSALAQLVLLAPMMGKSRCHCIAKTNLDC